MVFEALVHLGRGSTNWNALDSNSASARPCFRRPQILAVASTSFPLPRLNTGAGRAATSQGPELGSVLYNRPSKKQGHSSCFLWKSACRQVRVWPRGHLIAVDLGPEAMYELVRT